MKRLIIAAHLYTGFPVVRGLVLGCRVSLRFAKYTTVLIDQDPAVP